VPQISVCKSWSSPRLGMLYCELQYDIQMPDVLSILIVHGR